MTAASNKISPVAVTINASTCGIEGITVVGPKKDDRIK
jgi:hypothetical protein